jgi:transcriptional regulator with XRE-family HTH domain
MIPRDRAVLACGVGRLRVEKGWTFNDLSRETGMNGTYLKEIEGGQRDVGLDRLLVLARTFGLVSLEQLFGALPTESLLH